VGVQDKHRPICTHLEQSFYVLPACSVAPFSRIGHCVFLPVPARFDHSFRYVLPCMPTALLYTDNLSYCVETSLICHGIKAQCVILMPILDANDLVRCGTKLAASSGNFARSTIHCHVKTENLVIKSLNPSRTIDHLT
jgi:hypothetical protein